MCIRDRHLPVRVYPPWYLVHGYPHWYPKALAHRWGTFLNTPPLVDRLRCSLPLVHATKNHDFLYLFSTSIPDSGRGPFFAKKKNAKDVRDTGDGTPFAACDNGDPCRLVTIGNYIHSRVDIDLVRQIACDNEDLFLNFCRILPTLVDAILAKKVKSPHPQLSLISIDSPARPALPGLARL